MLDSRYDGAQRYRQTRFCNGHPPPFVKVRRIHVLLFILILAVGAIPFRAKLRSSMMNLTRTIRSGKSVADRVLEFGISVHNRLDPRFGELGITHPPKHIVLVGLKQEKLLEVWVSGSQRDFQHLKTYPILGASGTLGPKLAEGDGQVPEGLYQIESLNPNSRYHLALRVNYPNPFDKEKGRSDGRVNLGSDIMIHGQSVSIGCLAVGDEAAEDLFVLAAETGIENIKVILSPVDFRIRELPTTLPPLPTWTSELYTDIRTALARLKPQSPQLTNRLTGLTAP